jgi:hypothetical protein
LQPARDRRERVYGEVEEMESVPFEWTGCAYSGRVKREIQSEDKEKNRVTLNLANLPVSSAEESKSKEKKRRG